MLISGSCQYPMKRKQDFKQTFRDLHLTDVVCIAKIRRPEDSHVKVDRGQPPWREGLTRFFTFKHCFVYVKHNLPTWNTQATCSDLPGASHTYHTCKNSSLPSLGKWQMSDCCFSKGNKYNAYEI